MLRFSIFVFGVISEFGWCENGYDVIDSFSCIHGGCTHIYLSIFSYTIVWFWRFHHFHIYCGVPLMHIYNNICTYKITQNAEAGKQTQNTTKRKKQREKAEKQRKKAGPQIKRERERQTDRFFFVRLFLLLLLLLLLLLHSFIRFILWVPFLLHPFLSLYPSACLIYPSLSVWSSIRFFDPFLRSVSPIRTCLISRFKSFLLSVSASKTLSISVCLSFWSMNSLIAPDADPLFLYDICGNCERTRPILMSVCCVFMISLSDQ